MENLSQQELIEIQGGNDIEVFFFFMGYTAARNFDYAVGIIDGFVRG
ncbi:hypothetical protein [Croceivirga radicis]|nr:hypothetical protein [Croceivirga radicis]